jgi:hypothetical protein
MGLGKTAQSIAALEFQRQFAASAGPFLVIAPLTTLGCVHLSDTSVIDQKQKTTNPV